jgi:hypothetical protein
VRLDRGSVVRLRGGPRGTQQIDMEGAEVCS